MTMPERARRHRSAWRPLASPTWRWLDAPLQPPPPPPPTTTTTTKTRRLLTASISYPFDARRHCPSHRLLDDGDDGVDGSIYLLFRGHRHRMT